MNLRYCFPFTTQPERRTHQIVQMSCYKNNYTLCLRKNENTFTDANYWIFADCLGPCRDCSILARGGHAIKGDESRKCLLLIAPRSHYRPTAVGRQLFWVDTCPYTIHNTTHQQRGIHKYIHIPFSPSPPPRGKQTQFTWVEGRWQVAISLGNRVRGWRLLAYYCLPTKAYRLLIPGHDLRPCHISTNCPLV